MVDEVILREIREIIAKLLVYVKITDIDELAKKAGISKSALSEDERLDLLAGEYLSEIELCKYRQYRAYKRKKDLEVVATAVSSLQETTEKVGALYDEKSVMMRQINGINQEIQRLKISSQEIPTVRVRTMYAAVDRSYQEYSDVCIRSGMHQSTLLNRVQKIRRRNFVVRALKSGEVKRIKAELAEFSKMAAKQIKVARGRYNEELDKYYDFLREVILSLLKKPKFANALVLSAKYWHKDDIVARDDYDSVPRLAQDEIAEASEFVVEQFMDFFSQRYEENIDDEAFCQALREFILYYYTELAKNLNYKKQKCYDDIQGLFKKQSNVLAGLSEYNESFSSFEERLTDDQNDTYALIYASMKK